MLEVKFEQKVNGVNKGRAGGGKADVITVCMRGAASGTEGRRAYYINQEKWCDEKDEDVPEEVTLAKNFTLKNAQRYFTTSKAQRTQCWKLIQTEKGVCHFAKAQKRCLLLILHIS